MPTVFYDHSPSDTVFVINEDADSIKRGTCLQVVIKLQNNSNEELETNIKYLVLLEEDEGTVWVEATRIFATFEEAWTALGLLFNPTAVTNTPTPTPTITPTPSITPTITPTSSVTPTPSVTPTSSITPTPTVTPTETVTPTPSVTPSPI